MLAIAVLPNETGGTDSPGKLRPPTNKAGGQMPDHEQATAHPMQPDERRAGGVPNRSVLVPSDWRWKLMQWAVPAIAVWCVADAYLGSNGIKVTVTSLVGLTIMAGWSVASLVRKRSPQDALRIADAVLFLAAIMLIGQLCFAAAKPDPPLLKLAIQDLIIWAPLASGLSGLAYARRPWVPIAVTAATYLSLSFGVMYFNRGAEDSLRLPLHGLIIQALGILSMGVFFNRLRDTVSITIARLRLAEEQSHVDTLTGLFNRRKFDLDWARFSSERPGACLLLIDVDHFKRVNDEFGHAAGDAILATVGRSLSAAVLGRGVAYRWGGEEFALIVQGGALHARQIAQHILTEIASMTPPIGRPVTVSVGLSVAIAGESPAATFQRADDALMDAKRTGRNRIVYAAGAAPNGEFPRQARQHATRNGAARLQATPSANIRS